MMEQAASQMLDHQWADSLELFREVKLCIKLSSWPKAGYCTGSRDARWPVDQDTGSMLRHAAQLESAAGFEATLDPARFFRADFLSRACRYAVL